MDEKQFPSSRFPFPPPEPPPIPSNAANLTPWTKSNFLAVNFLAVSNNGIGDISFSLTKQLLAQTDKRPSLLAQIDYIAPTGEDPFETATPLGSGFHTVAGSLSGVKSIDPLAFYGNISYAHSFSRSFQGARFQPGDVIGVGVGSTLAATPEIALSLGMDLAFADNFKVDGVPLSGSNRTIGIVSVGAGFLLNQRVYLSISGQFGVTDDAPDLGLSVAVPLRF